MGDLTDDENWPLTTERIAQVLADVRKTPCPRSACCMDDVDRVRFALHIIAEKALAELIEHRAARTSGAELVRAVVREAVNDWHNCSGSCGDEEHERMARHIANRVVAQLPAPGDGSPGWRAGIEASIRHLEAMGRKPHDLWHRAYFAAVDEALVHLQAMLERGTDRSATSVAALPPAQRAELDRGETVLGHVCPVPYGLGSEDLDALSELVSLAEMSDWPRARAVVRKILAASRCPEPTIEPLPELIQCATMGCVSSIKKTYLPSGWRLTDGAWACPRCKVLAISEAS